MVIDAHLVGIDWTVASGELDDRGCAILEGLLTADECAPIAGSYDDDRHFRSRIVMARHGFGRGEYKYFAYPLPAIVDRLRTALYVPLAPIANPLPERPRGLHCAVPRGGTNTTDAAAAAIRSG